MNSADSLSYDERLHCVVVLFVSHRDVREAWIRAKYIQKAFLRRLPMSGEPQQNGAGKGQASPAKRWSVLKRKRRSPPKDKEGKQAGGGESRKDEQQSVEQGEMGM